MLSIQHEFLLHWHVLHIEMVLTINVGMDNFGVPKRPTFTWTFVSCMKLQAKNPRECSYVGFVRTTLFVLFSATYTCSANFAEAIDMWKSIKSVD